jgi:hypothetical protein
MDIEKLREKAAALGCSFQRGPQKYSGYVLIDSNGHRPLGDGYTASLADIKQYLDDLSEDDIEAGRETTTKPLSNMEISKALAQHPEEAQIKRTLEQPIDTPPKLTKEERSMQKQRETALYWTPGQRDAYWRVGLPGGMLPEDAARLSANASQAKLEQDKIDSTAARQQPPQYWRVTDQTKISPDDPLFVEKSRRKRLFQEAAQALPD